MTGFNYIQLAQLLAPQVILVIGALLVLFFDQVLARSFSGFVRNLAGTIITAVTALVSIFWIGAHPETGSHYNGMLALDFLTQFVQQGVIWLTFFTALVTHADHFTDHIGEFFSLLLLGTIGLTFLVSSGELLTAFVSLELASLTLYILAAFNKHNRNSAEGALKYFLFGSSAAAFTIFGISLVYGITGTTVFDRVALALRGPADPALYLALVFVAAGFAFKVAAAPFHLWAPDAYQGAPAPAAAFIASGSKLASFFLFGRFFIEGLATQKGDASWGSFNSGWVMILAVLAFVSMLYGNLAAIVQSNFRRLVAYSAVAHAGYAILGILSSTTAGMYALVYYMFTYGLAVIGIFGIVQAIEHEHGELALTDFAGLNRRSPVLAICLAIFLLSLAGIPPLAGFFGKFYLFASILKSDPKNLGMLWLVIAAVAASAVSLFYYLQVLKQAFVVETPPAHAPAIGSSRILAIAALAMGIVIFGCFPELILKSLRSDFEAHSNVSLAPSTTSMADP